MHSRVTPCPFSCNFTFSCSKKHPKANYWAKYDDFAFDTDPSNFIESQLSLVFQDVLKKPKSAKNSHFFTKSARKSVFRSNFPAIRGENLRFGFFPAERRILLFAFT